MAFKSVALIVIEVLFIIQFYPRESWRFFQDSLCNSLFSGQIFGAGGFEVGIRHIRLQFKTPKADFGVRDSEFGQRARKVPLANLAERVYSPKNQKLSFSLFSNYGGNTQHVGILGISSSQLP